MDYSDFNLGGTVSVPTVLLTNTTWWPCASRLAIALTKAGCNVSAVYPARGHPLAQTSVIRQRYPYSAIHPVDSLAEAVRAAKSDFVVPCDDRAVEHLHQLYARQDGVSQSDTRRLIQQSLGAPASYPSVSNRFNLLKIALEQGLPAPETELVHTADALHSWGARHGFPWVLKADGTWGGHGVKIARNQKEAEEFLSQMSAPLSATRAIKRLVVDRDPFWILPWRERGTSRVIIQSYIEGRPANCAVVCWNGKVLAGIAVEVVCAQGETGSATVVRVVDHPGMMLAAERLVSRLGLSGFLGFDFVIEERTGTAYLIEMNPRVTPLCHLQLGRGRDLVSAITAQLSGEPNREASTTPDNEMIAYFPQAWHWDRKSPLLRSSFQDVPWEEPGLVHDLLRLPWPDRGILARISNSLRHLTFQDRKARGGDFPAVPPGRGIEPQAKGTSPSRRQPPAASGRGSDELKPSCIITLRQDGSRHPLFLIHGVDGSVNRFYRLLRHLELDRPVYGILAQGLLRERAALTRLERLAAYYLEQVREVQPHGPCHFVGYSFGAYVAFEMARQLHSRREFAGMVGMIDVMPMGGQMSPDLLPGVPNGDSGQPSPRRSAIAFHSKRMFSPGGLDYAREKLQARFMRTIYTLMASTNQPIPPFLQRAYDLNWFAAVRYAPQSFPGKITLFHSVASSGEQYTTGDSWARIAEQGIELRQILGDHETIFEEPQVRSLAKEVMDWLAAE